MKGVVWATMKDVFREFGKVSLYNNSLRSSFSFMIVISDSTQAKTSIFCLCVFILKHIYSSIHTYMHLPVCLWVMDPHSRAPRRIQAIEMRCYRKMLHISYRDHVTNEEVCAKIQQAIRSHEDPNCNGMVMSLVHLVWPKPSCRHNERGKKTRQTEEEAGRHRQGTDRPGVWQVPEGSGTQGKMEETGCKIVCGAPTTLAFKG